MSSHREAPQISKDPAADNTDVYAFVDQTDPTKVNLIANFNPFEIPYGGPNFSEFDDDVLYTINISNAGTAEADLSYQFRFTTKIVNPDTFLYNTGPLSSNTDPAFNRPQTYSVTKVTRSAKGKLTSRVLAKDLVVPPCNVGDRSTPDYEANFGSHAVHALGGPKRTVFAGPRSDAFFVDLGSIFDLGGLRPLNQAHEIPLATMDGMNGLQGLNVHTIALQLPITDLTKGGTRPTSMTATSSVIGVWASTFRSRGRQFIPTVGKYKSLGGFVQISRLGNPLINEVINPMSEKDKWNSHPPRQDSQFAKYVATPELAQLLPSLYPNQFPHLAAFNQSGRPRIDLEAVVLTGIPSSILGTFGTATGGPLADMLRLNLAVPPTASGSENNLGVLYGDNAGFPNGRRVIDDVTTIELRAIAGLSIHLAYSDYTADSILNGDSVRDGTSNTNLPLLDVFPYLAPPASGYATTPPTPSVGTH